MLGVIAMNPSSGRRWRELAEGPVIFDAKSKVSQNAEIMDLRRRLAALSIGYEQVEKQLQIATDYSVQ